MSGPTEKSGKRQGLTYLCVVDQSEELHQAVYFACRRAKRSGGRVALLSVVEPPEFQHWIAEELMKLIEEETEISVLVLGAATGSEGPGPLVSHLLNKMAGRMRLTISIVPGILTDEQIDAIT